MSTAAKPRLGAVRFLVLLIVLVASVAIFLLRDQLKDLPRYGYPGIFLFSVLTNATVLLPVPGNILVFAMGAALNPLGVAIAAAMGAAGGELAGYLAGFSGQAVIENAERYQRMLKWLENHRKWMDLAIFVLAAIPNPLFDMAGIAAGALRLPAWRFLLFCFLGKFINMSIFAFAGSLSATQIFKP
jgi:membrane protein YqaA with SNARE-associated domain